MTIPKESKTHFEQVPLEVVKKVVEKTRVSKRPEPVRPPKFRKNSERHPRLEGTHTGCPSVHIRCAA